MLIELGDSWLVKIALIQIITMKNITKFSQRMIPNWFVVGFTDGDGTFTCTITKQAKKTLGYQVI